MTDISLNPDYTDMKLTPPPEPPEPRPAPALEGSQAPLTPPLESKRLLHQEPESKAPSPDTTASPGSSRSHQEYLDSLRPPSGDEIQRLAELQDQRARDRKQHTRELRHKSADIAKTEASAQRDFMESRQHHCIQSTLKQAQAQTRSSPESSGGSGSGPRSSAAAAAPPVEGVDAATAAADNNALDGLQNKAATLIQRSYRGYRVRREMKGLSLDASTRWTYAIRDAKWQNLNTPRARGSGTTSPDDDDDEEGAAGGAGTRPRSSASAARQNWKKVAAIAMRANGDVDSSHSESESESESSSDLEMNENMTEKQKKKIRKWRAKAKAKRRKKAKMMEWKKADTNENFFYWLDYGTGKNLEIEAAPGIGWRGNKTAVLAKNGIRLDTTEEWKDSVNGIVPVEDPTPAYAPDVESHSQQHHDPARHPEDHDSTSGSDEDSDASESELEAARAAKYATPTLDDAKGVKKIKHVSAATIFNRLLRVAHLGRGPDQDQERAALEPQPALGPLPPPAANFRAFVQSLRDEGVDMSRVSISKSYAVLVGLEAYVKTRRKGKDALHKATLHRDRILDPEEVARREEAERDKSESAAKERQFLQEEEEKRGESRGGGMRFLQRLGFRPREKKKKT
ncbi:hypothetical protein PG994_007900 [Apiospora phragmitis]|uniref:Uncharacterized protein n=1 Tax=Apiospora phragmitis TaxID=2905665 RepID=A0ABR1UUK5_9PEZI